MEAAAEKFEPEIGNRFWVDIGRYSAVVEIVGTYHSARKAHYRARIIDTTGDQRYVGKTITVSDAKLTGRTKIFNGD